MAAERGRTRPERRGELGGRGPHQSTTGKTGSGRKRTPVAPCSLQKQAERIERGQKRRQRTPTVSGTTSGGRKAPRSPWTPGLHPLCLREVPVPPEPAEERVGREHLGELKQQLGGRARATSSRRQLGGEPTGRAHTRCAPGVLRERGQAQRTLFAFAAKGSEGSTRATAEQSGAGRTAQEGGKATSSTQLRLTRRRPQAPRKLLRKHPPPQRRAPQERVDPPKRAAPPIRPLGSTIESPARFRNRNPPRERDGSRP